MLRRKGYNKTPVVLNPPPLTLSMFMRFHQFTPEYSAKERARFIEVHDRQVEGMLKKITELLVIVEEMHSRNRRPFYRVYPGVLHALTRLGIEKIDITKVTTPVNGLALEFPEETPFRAADQSIRNIAFVDLETRMIVEWITLEGKRGVTRFLRTCTTITDWLPQQGEADREILKSIMQVVFGVCMIPQSDTDLIEPLVLNRDKEKYAATGDPKYIDRAKRNGMNGWNLGRNIPTPEEMEEFREQSGEVGRKSPHWRIGHFRKLRPEDENSPPVITWVRETFVNKDLLKEVPHGYYGKETE